eukprot:7282667-Ditylum_brightwellii.AAC.1
MTVPIEYLGDCIQRKRNSMSVTELHKKLPEEFTDNNQQELLHLNNEIGKAMLDPEKKFPIYNQPWWFTNMHSTHLLVKYWKKKLTFLKGNTGGTKILEEIENQLGVEVDVFQGDPQ